MITKGRDRRETFTFLYIFCIIITLCCYFNDQISGTDLFMGILGFGIVWALLLTLEFDTDEELRKEN